MNEKGRLAPSGKRASPITLHGHRRPRLYREQILAPLWIPCKRKSLRIILP